MKIRFAVVLATCVLVAQSLFAGSTVVISQVYGGGGNAGATLKNDFIELHNRGSAPVSVAGWSVQYASSAGTTWQVTGLTGSIPAGGYYLVQEAPGAGGTINLPTPDATGTIPMSASGGKVALVSSAGALTGGCPAGVVDFVGYDGANCFEGAGAAPTLSNTAAAIRANSGCTDTDNNAADFSSGAPNPRNTGSAAQACPNNPPSITPPASPITTVNQDAAPFTVSLTGSDDFSTYNWSATTGTGVSAVSVTSGQGTANVTYTVTLQTGFSGIATFTASLSDNVNPAVTQAVNIKVNAVAVDNPPSIIAPANPITSVAQDSAPFTVSLTGTDDGGVYNWSAAPGTGVASVSVTGGQGTATATFTVNVQSGFNGTASFTASLSDSVNAPATQIVNIAVTPPPDHLVISQIYGGGGNSGAPLNADYVQLHNPTSSPIDVTGWTLQYASASGNTWTNNQPLGGIIGPNEYFLIALATGSTGAPLPAANINGTINMSATAGKLALVRNGVPRSGICPKDDADVVDFVGYGTTASCAEGNLNAPAASNTTALFRKNGGNTDSNNNLADFTTGPPNPFRTTPLQELGPWVSSTDPSLNVTNAPHDSSITVDFSEPVDVDANWYAISCTSSGMHNDATVVNTSDFKEYVITPNVNFNFGEQCTVTILKTTIHDQDTNDSAPGTDTLAADYVWTFTVVAAGQPAPYPPSVHLTMGNPTNATADVTQPDNFLMEKPTYALSYNRSKGTPNWVSWHLTNEWYGSLARLDTFRPDPALPPAWYRVQAFDFFTTGFDRGHMCPNADRDNQNRVPINQETYLMSNMVPQAPDNNQGPWANLENYLRSLTDAGNEIYIVSGPAGIGGTGSNGGITTTLANGHVTVPAETWKVALVLTKGDNDISRVTAATRTIAVIMPNIQGIKTSNSNDWMTYLTTVDEVEAHCHCDLFANVPEAIRNAINAGVNGVNPPGAANESVSTNEDTSKAFTLDVASASGNPLTYTVGAPLHGTLTGSDGNRTYTPAPDYNGSDSFTYTVSDGSLTSNTATVTVTVLEVNDPPVTTGDAKSVEAGSTLTFAATDLSANDKPGPDNESSQTLTVTAANATANTHGTVSLAGGLVTYTPDVPFAGAASFTYQVCDNGFTAGLSDPRCSTGTVSVTVTDTTPPTMTPLTLSSTQLWPPNHQMVSVTVDYTATDLGDPAPVCSLGITSNEPINGTGDGDSAPDWEIVDAHHARLRAERAATGTGRIYTVAATCNDASGNVAQKSATVSVPKSQK